MTAETAKREPPRILGELCGEAFRRNRRGDTNGLGRSEKCVADVCRTAIRLEAVFLPDGRPFAFKEREGRAIVPDVGLAQ